MAIAYPHADQRINPFDQPNVEGAKRATSEILASGRKRCPRGDGLQELLSTLSEGDYVAIQAYVDPTPATEELLTASATDDP